MQTHEIQQTDGKALQRRAAMPKLTVEGQLGRSPVMVKVATGMLQKHGRSDNQGILIARIARPTEPNLREKLILIQAAFSMKMCKTLIQRVSLLDQSVIRFRNTCHVNLLRF